jgi:hypothetical protein
MSDTDAIHQELVEAEIRLAWKGQQLRAQAAYDLIEAATGIRPQDLAELAVLTARYLGEPRETILRLTLDELLARLRSVCPANNPGSAAPPPTDRRTASKKRVGDSPRSSLAKATDTKLTPTEGRILELYAEAVRSMGGLDLGTLPSIKQVYSWVKAQGLYSGRYSAFRKALCRAKSKLKSTDEFKTPRSAVPREHFSDR